ncbi:hypothetical protein BGZ76_004169 [Entomortierella beljakovae]|nr:hypothetical protein BGZ76_004169 [Entomortierella beljakovae]
MTDSSPSTNSQSSLPNTLTNGTPLTKRTAFAHALSHKNLNARPTNKCLLSQLPPELTFQILSYLPYRSLVSISRVDQYWRKLIFQQDGILWYRLCQYHGFISPERFSPINCSIKSTVAKAQNERPGLSRAIAQSRKRLADDGELHRGHFETYQQPMDSQKSNPLRKRGQPTGKLIFPSMRTWDGRIESWRDYFESSIILEREWIEGKPTVKELIGHYKGVLCVKILPLWDRIVSGDLEGHINIWCAQTGTLLRRFTNHRMSVSCFSVHGNLLVSGSWDSTVIIWEQIETKPYLKKIKIVDLGEQVTCMDVDSDMNLAIGAVSGAVKVVSIKTFASVETFRCNRPDLCAAVSLNQNKVEAAIGENYYAWDRNTKAQAGYIGDAHLGHISCMKIDTDKKLIFTGARDSRVRVFSWESKPMLLQQYGSHRSSVRCMVLQDNMVITGSSDKTIMITFRERTESHLDSYQEHENKRNTEPISLTNSGKVNCVDADASIIVAGGDDGIVRIFDFGYDLWRPPTPASPRLCGQASLVSLKSPTCVLMAKKGRSNVSVGNRRQTYGTCALAVLRRAKDLLYESLGDLDINMEGASTNTPFAWMNVDEIYQKMIEWEMLPVSQGSNPRHTLNLALHMMANLDSPTVILDSSASPHRFAPISSLPAGVSPPPERNTSNSLDQKLALNINTWPTLATGAIESPCGSRVYECRLIHLSRASEYHP